MRVDVRARIVGHNGDVRFGLRIVVERDGKLRVDLPIVAERTAKCREHAADRSGMPAALRLADDQHTVHQLEALARLEDTQLDESLVLDTGPASSLGRKG